MANQSKTAIHRGDFIEVTHHDENGTLDLLVRGAALTDLGGWGSSSTFSVRTPTGRALELNANDVEVRKLFDAYVLDEEAAS